jgi:hypothetical protein
MIRIACASLVLAVVAGCQAPAERVPLRPLPEDSLPLPYSELLTRARIQASGATESFYVNRWGDLEDFARGLEQTAHFLGKATEVPATHRAKLAGEAMDLEKDAGQLRDAAKSQDAKRTNEVMQRVNLKVRELRLDN